MNFYQPRGLYNAATRTGDVELCPERRSMTCYANAVLQTLISLPDIRYYCLTVRDSFPDTDEGRLGRSFVRLVRKYLSGVDNNPENVRALCKRHLDFMDKLYQLGDNRHKRYLAERLASPQIKKYVEDLKVYKKELEDYKKDPKGKKPVEPRKPVIAENKFPADGTADAQELLTELVTILGLEGLFDFRFPYIRYTSLPKYIVMMDSGEGETKLPEFYDFGLNMPATEVAERGRATNSIYHLNNRILFGGAHYTADLYVKKSLDRDNYGWININDAEINNLGVRLGRGLGGRDGTVFVYKRMTRTEVDRFITSVRAEQTYIAPIDQPAEHRRVAEKVRGWEAGPPVVSKKGGPKRRGQMERRRRWEKEYGRKKPRYEYGLEFKKDVPLQYERSDSDDLAGDWAEGCQYNAESDSCATTRDSLTVDEQCERDLNKRTTKTSCRKKRPKPPPSRRPSPSPSLAARLAARLGTTLRGVPGTSKPKSKGCMYSRISERCIPVSREGVHPLCNMSEKGCQKKIIGCKHDEKSNQCETNDTGVVDKKCKISDDAKCQLDHTGTISDVDLEDSSEPDW